MGGVLERKGLVTFSSFDLSPVTAQASSGKGAGAPQSFTPATAVILRADDNNSTGGISYGMGGTANAILYAGETDAYDFPPGYFCDLSQLCVSGTTGDVLHVRFFVLESVPGIT